jgi:hypothetical protein
MAMMHQVSQDPVFEALGLMGAQNAAAAEQEWMATMACQQATPFEYSLTDPTQLAWYQAQSMIAAAYQLQQMATWQAQAASLLPDAGLAALMGANADSSYLLLPPGLPAAAATAPAAELTPRSLPAAASEATPIKTAALPSDVSTAPGSPSADTETSEQEHPVLLENLLFPLKEPMKEFVFLPPPPPPATPTKLDLHAIIFEKAKDPISSHLLQLIKKGPEDNTEGQEKGKALLELLHQSEQAAPQPRNGPLASGAHRKGAAAARAAAAAAAAAGQQEDEEVANLVIRRAARAAAAAGAQEDEEVVRRRRRPRGGRGGRK